MHASSDPGYGLNGSVGTQLRRNGSDLVANVLQSLLPPDTSEDFFNQLCRDSEIRHLIGTGQALHHIKLVVEQRQRSDEKKRSKRAANRRSASLSRARKKRLVEMITTTNIRLQHRKRISEALPVAIMALDKEGAVVYVSPRVAELLDIEAEQCVGTSLRDLMAPSSRAVADDLLYSLVDSEPENGDDHGDDRDVSPRPEQDGAGSDDSNGNSQKPFFGGAGAANGNGNGNGSGSATTHEDASDTTGSGGEGSGNGRSDATLKDCDAASTESGASGDGKEPRGVGGTGGAGAQLAHGADAHNSDDSSALAGDERSSKPSSNESGGSTGNSSDTSSSEGGDNGKVASAHPAEAPRVYICADGERLCHLRFKVGGVAEKVLEVRGKMRLVSAPSEEEDEAEEDAAARKRGRGEKDEEDGAAQKGAADVVEELLILSLRESAEALRFEAERA